jgi:hypothetical protein
VSLPVWPRAARRGVLGMFAVAVVVLSVQPAALANSFTAPGWTKQAPPAHPPARFLAPIAYDAATGNTVLFGGLTRKELGDTWTWNGSTWTKQAPATSPPARSGASMAYDAATGNIVLFGGAGSHHHHGLFDDTWTWNGSTWTKHATATHPSARNSASMAYDAATGNIVLFGGGGFGSGPDPLGDTWTWDGSTWTKQAPAAHPSAAFAPSMAYDAATGNTVLFGGGNSHGSLSGTWTWDGSTWTKQAPATSPPARQYGSMAYDAATGNIVLFGGGGGSSGLSPLGDTWTWGATAEPGTVRVRGR